MRRRLLLPAFLAGAGALCFEVVWARQMTIEAGGPLASFTITVGMFMLGLALGGAWFGRVADRTAFPLRLFGILQCAASAVIFTGAALIASGGAVRPLLLWLGPTPASLPFYLLEVTVGGGLACLAAMAMGGTLPLLVKSSASADAEMRSVGPIAACNAAGAAAGSLACGFILLPGLGVTRSLLATGVATLVNGACVVLLRTPEPASSRPGAGCPPRFATRIHDATSHRAAILLALFLGGLAATSLEIVWTRLAFLSFGSSVQAGSLVLSAVIAGLALGNGLGARLGQRAAEPIQGLALLAVGAGLSI
ncbi:MAG TPA: hypothetical protein VFE84_01780, partial [Patescibacteria group bacterium]|nr:hypothetical protein [Patescibacteria group bacterium]